MKKLLTLILTAVLCLCCLASCGILGFHPISYQDAKTERLLMEGYAPKRAKPGDTVVLRTGPIMDANLYLYANGVPIENTHNDSDYWEYTFIMPDEDVVITHKMSDGFIQEKCVDHIDEDDNGICDYCGHRHTIYYLSEKAGHFTNYTCGCSHDAGMESHYDENIDCICDACGYDMNEDYPPLVDETISLRNLTGCAWLNEINAEDIAEIKIIGEAVGVAPGNLKNILGSTDEAVIARIFEEYYCLDTRTISKMDGQIDGGSGVTVKFILKDGTAKELYINNGNYRDTNGNYFELNSVPKFKDTDNAVKAYGFITYIGTGTVYDKDNNPVCEISMDEFEFVAFEGDLPAVITGYYYTVDSEFGTWWFTYNSEIFFVRFDGEENYTESYQLVGKNLDELIAEYSAE